MGIEKNRQLTDNSYPDREMDDFFGDGPDEPLPYKVYLSHQRAKAKRPESLRQANGGTPPHDTKGPKS